MRASCDWLTRGAVAMLLMVAFGAAAGRCQSIQCWPEVDLTLNARRTNLLIPSLARFDSSQPNPQFVATGAVGTYRFNRRWAASLGYLFAELPQHDQAAHLPLAAITTVWTRGQWSFSDTHRFERLMDYSNQPYRYRNRIAADRAFGRNQKRNVYASDEFFVNLSEGAWNQNRVQAGMGFVVRPGIRLDGYFLQRSAPGGKETSAVGTVVTIALNRPHG